MTSDLLMRFPVATEQGFPHGLRCALCHRGIEEGQPYGAGVPEYVDDAEILTLTCVYCTT